MNRPQMFTSQFFVYNQVEKLYQGYTKVQGYFEILPIVLSRLECIKAIHIEGGNLGPKMIEIKENDKNIAKQLAEGATLIEKVNKKQSLIIQLEEDLKTNLESLFKEINDLQLRAEGNKKIKSIS